MTKNLQSDFRSWWQVSTTLLLAVCTFSTIFLLHSNYGVWPTILLTPLMGLIGVRTFVLYHDCIHFSLFSSRAVNHYVAEFLSVVGFHPNLSWSGNHLYHHAHFGKLTAIGRGDIPVATTYMYKRSDKNTKRIFRLFRSVCMPWILSAVNQVVMRSPLWNKKSEYLRSSTHADTRVIEGLKKTTLYNVLIIVFLALLHPAMPVYYLFSVYLTFVVSFYLFFIQHAHEGTVFEKDRHWNHEESAIRGSSYLKVGKITEYFLCSINYHHVHHYNASIPNYLLKEFHEEHFKDDPRLHILETFTDIAKCFDTKLWDTKNKKWVKNFRT